MWPPAALKPNFKIGFVMFRKFFSIVLLVALVVFIYWLIKDQVYTFKLVIQEAPSNLPIPVAGVVVTNLQDTWGAPRSEGRQHQGIDIFAPRGTAVFSATNGVVWKLGQNRLGGNVVWVLGPGGSNALLCASASLCRHRCRESNLSR